MTAQTPESILLDGEEWLLLGTPLDPFLGRTWSDEPVCRTQHGTISGVSGQLAGRLRGATVPRRHCCHGARAGFLAPRFFTGPRLCGVLSCPWQRSSSRGGFGWRGGNQVRHVHSDFDSVWEEEILLEVDKGRILSRQRLAEPSRMGSAGPYRLHEPLLGDLTGGGFGQVITATDLDGRSLVAKVPLPRGGGPPDRDVDGHPRWESAGAPAGPGVPRLARRVPGRSKWVPS